jgi:hypothetical protein
VQYEAQLGHFIAQHPLTISCAQALIQACWRYFQVRARWTAKSPSQQPLEFGRLLQRCSLPLTDKYTGRVGEGVAQIRRVYQGQANVREMMAHLWAFNTKHFCADLVGPEKLPDALSIAHEAGLNTAEIEAMIAEAVAYNGISSNESALDPKDDFVKMPWHPVRQLQEATRLPNPLAENGDIWSRQTRRQFVSEGGIFSPMELRLKSGLGAVYVPWLDARRQWLPNETHPFVKTARQAQLPLGTGLSGMTMQFIQLARILNVGPDEYVRLACLGYLLSTKSHSFYEIMAVGEFFGCEYEAGNYHILAPLSPQEIVRYCGVAPKIRP